MFYIHNITYYKVGIVEDMGDMKVNKIQLLSLSGSRLLGQWDEGQEGKWELVE